MPQRSPPQPKKLTLKQELFINAYLGGANGNATEAARQAGYKNPEISAKNNVRNHTISARIGERLDAVGASADDVLRELTSVAMAPWIDFVEIVGRNKAGEATKVRSDIGSKVKALELLGKYHQLFTDNVKLTGRIDHVHRVPDGLRNLSDDELDALEAIAARAMVTGDR